MRCSICNLFMKQDGAFYSWVPYGNSGDLEPPDEVFAHIKCYKGLSERERALIITTAWLMPHITPQIEYPSRQGGKDD
jgi:hypothetical protein